MLSRIYKNDLVIALLVVLATFLLYTSNIHRDYNIDLDRGTYRRLMTSGDVIPNTFLPYTLLTTGTVDFDDEIDVIRMFEGNKKRPYFIIFSDDHYYSVYPVLTGLLALPVYVVPILLNKIPELTYHENMLKVLVLGRLSASLLAALSVGLMYLILRKVSDRKNLILLFTVFYAFGTSTYSITSRGLWQHTSSQLILSVVLLLFLKALSSDKKNILIPSIGFFLGAAVFTRPTNIIFAIVLTIYVFFNYRKYLLTFILGALPWVVFMLIYNYFIFGSILTEGYQARNDFHWSEHWTTPLLTSLSGYALSPARSFLFISPPLIFGFYTIYKIFKDKSNFKKNNTLYRYLSVALILSILMFAKWYTWSGSPGFGNRMLSDFLPIITLLSFETIKSFKKIGLAIVGVLIVYSIYVHTNAVLFRKSRCSPDHNWTFYCLMPPKEKAQY